MHSSEVSDDSTAAGFFYMNRAWASPRNVFMQFSSACTVNNSYSLRRYLQGPSAQHQQHKPQH